MMQATSSLAPAAVPASATPIKAMVVDDAIVVRGLIGKWLDEETDIEVVARHRNGKEALDDLDRVDPDIVVLDIEMPVMDGLTALPLMLKKKPGLCVIMASTLTLRNAEMSLKALSLGATDYIPKPEGSSSVSTSAEFRSELVRKVRQLGSLKGRSTRPGGSLGSRRPERPAMRAVTDSGMHTRTGTDATARGAGSAAAARPDLTLQTRRFSSVAPRIVLIGSSTGGPQALTSVMQDIGQSLSHLPIVITQHMPPNFTAILARNLGKAAGVPAAEAEHNQILKPGHVYVAPGGSHTVLAEQSGQICTQLLDTPPINYCKPAVDPLMESGAALFGPACLATILTGMGSDGAKGVKAIADKGGSVIAQDEATSVVWGMPKAAAESGACAAILPLASIGPKIRHLAGRG